MSLRGIGLKLHKAIASSRPASTLYFRAASFCLKPLPDGSFKSRWVNNARSIEWPPVILPAQNVEIGGVRFRISPNLGEDDMESLVMRDLKYEPGVFSYLKSSPRKYDAVIEIGANVGIYTLFFSKFYEGCQVYAFEPSREAYARLLKNVALNPSLKNIQTFNVAVGAHEGFLTFYQPKGHLKNGSLRKNFASIFSSDVEEYRVRVVEGTSLEDTFRKHRSVLLKIDAEGSEALILKSLMPVIRLYKPDILLECLEIFEGELNSLGLSELHDFYCLTQNGPVHCPELRHSPESRDYMLLPLRRSGG